MNIPYPLYFEVSLRHLHLIISHLRFFYSFVFQSSISIQPFIHTFVYFITFCKQRSNAAAAAAFLGATNFSFSSNLLVKSSTQNEAGGAFCLSSIRLQVRFIVSQMRKLSKAMRSNKNIKVAVNEERGAKYCCYGCQCKHISLPTNNRKWKQTKQINKPS